MWWNIIKDVKTISQTQGSFDFEEEEIPEKDEPDCKEKLLAIQDALIDFRPTGTKYRGASHKRGSDVMQSFIYQEKPYDETKKGNKLGHAWVYEGNTSGMIIHSNRQAVRNLTNEEACQVLEDLKRIWNEGNTRGLVTRMNNAFSNNERPHRVSITLVKNDEPIYKIYIGKQDPDFARRVYNEMMSFIRKQVK